MSAPEPLLLLSGFALIEEPTVSLEDRVNAFLRKEPSNESLDDGQFNHANGSEKKADWLLSRRRIIAEMKTLNGDPLERVERRMQARFQQPDAPVLFGTMGMGPAIDSLADRDEQLKIIHDLSARKVRSNLKTASEQIKAIKERFELDAAAGLAIILNQTEEMIDAANIAYSVFKAFQEHPEIYAHIDYVWASIESVRIKLPDGSEGYPQLLISRSRTPPPDHIHYLARMVSAWALSNGSTIQEVPHRGDYDTLQPIYKNGPPILDLN